jgi:hypothetical protein
MAREKAHDEMFCRACGEPIKKKAEICPECGVANEGQSSQSSSTTGSRQRGQQSNQSTSTQSTSTTQQETPHDPSRHSTTVSENWNYAVAASLALWIVGFAMPEGSATAGFFFLVGWILMPVSIYFDRQWVAATTEWNPDETTWLVLAAIPLVNIVAGGVYLFRRYNLDQIAPADGGSTATVGQSSEDPALDNLRERYANGELSDAEFEQKVEAIVGTEDAETAEMHVTRQTSDASDE